MKIRRMFNMDVNVNYAPEVKPAPIPQAPAPDIPSAPVPAVREVPVVDTKQGDNGGKPADRRPQENVEKAIEQINKSIAPFNRHMNISVHAPTNRIMVKVIDTHNDEVIREIPPEKVLDAFAASLELAGILLDKRQ